MEPSQWRRDDDAVLWSTHRQGDPRSIAHQMEPDGHGRPTSPLCGCSTEGLFFRRDHDWSHVPPAQRCRRCAQAIGGTASL